MEVTTELKCRLRSDPLAKKWFYESFGLPVTYSKSDVLGNISELFPDTPIKLLKDVFQALELHDLVEILEKVLKPRTLRPTLPLKEIKKMTNSSNRPTRYYNEAAVLVIDTRTGRAHSKTGRIGSFFKEFNSQSRVTTVTTTLPRLSGVTNRWQARLFDFESGHPEGIRKRIELLQREELELRLRDLKGWISLGNYPADVERLLRTEEVEMKKELEEHKAIMRMKKKDKRVTIEKNINQMKEELQKEKEKIEMILEEWVLCKGGVIQ